MELIFPKSTFARLTPITAEETFWVEAEVGVGVAGAAAELEFILAALAGVVRGFDAASDFVALVTAVEALSFSTPGKEIIQINLFLN